MPRQDVPYGGAICRLKERIAEIWDKLGEKLHSINGVEGDAAGDVKIVSGDAAITISDDQVNHQITIGLDQAELPSAAVTSVNGETGAVVLDGDDIELINGAGVTAANAIITNGQRLATLQGDLNTEISDRQTADAALQGNINTVQASIPTAAATAVANDPTVAQLATDVPNKLDKIVSGSTLKAYTHTSATQGETAISSGTDANSIGLRDADGRMHGADPASGATDKTLVTANWVSQTGAGRPNNLIHDGGNEKVQGIKTFYSQNTILIGQSHGGWEQGQLIIRDYRTDANHTISTNNPNFELARIIITDGNSNYAGSIAFSNYNGITTCTLYVRNADGTRNAIILGSGNA